MQVFNVVINGADAMEFCKQSVEFKVKWIMQHTNQKNKDLIMQWINNPPKNDSDCGCGCGGHKQDPLKPPVRSRKRRNRK